MVGGAPPSAGADPTPAVDAVRRLVEAGAKPRAAAARGRRAHGRAGERALPTTLASIRRRLLSSERGDRDDFACFAAMRDGRLDPERRPSVRSRADSRGARDGSSGRARRRESVASAPSSVRCGGRAGRAGAARGRWRGPWPVRSRGVRLRGRAVRGAAAHRGVGLRGAAPAREVRAACAGRVRVRGRAGSSGRRQRALRRAARVAYLPLGTLAVRARRARGRGDACSGPRPAPAGTRAARTSASAARDRWDYVDPLRSSALRPAHSHRHRAELPPPAPAAPAGRARPPSRRRSARGAATAPHPVASVERPSRRPDPMRAPARGRLAALARGAPAARAARVALLARSAVRRRRWPRCATRALAPGLHGRARLRRGASGGLHRSRAPRLRTRHPVAARPASRRPPLASGWPDGLLRHDADLLRQRGAAPRPRVHDDRAPTSSRATCASAARTSSSSPAPTSTASRSRWRPSARA